MEKFLNLPIEKQNSIINAGLNTFAENGYKKTSVRDIANAAGISKSLIFHYFGTKKDFYVFLAQYSSNIIINEINTHLNKDETDFFERIKLIAQIEVSLMKRYPGILLFLKSIYFESDEEVVHEIKTMMMQGDSFRSHIGLDGIDVSKFKEGVDPALVMKMLTWFAEGYINQFRVKSQIDIDDISREFNLCLDMLKQNLYKGEFL